MLVEELQIVGLAEQRQVLADGEQLYLGPVDMMETIILAVDRAILPHRRADRLAGQAEQAAGLVAEAKSWDRQNRLGFTVSLARDVARHRPVFGQVSRPLKALEEMLMPSRLAGEDTCGGG
jgi:hypothetical protein